MSNVTARAGVIQSVDRALAVMEILARAGWSGVTDMSGELGLHKSTVSRLLSTLERRGMVEQHTATQKYRLGPGIVRLAASVRSSADLAGTARPVCERLSAQTGETVNLAVLDGDEVVNIDQVNVAPAVVNVDWQGRRTVLHATSNGKVLLAHLPSGDRDRLLAVPLAAATPHTIVDPVALRAELEVIRARGYGVTQQELELGLSAVAAPIHGPDGALVATICVSGPSFRLGAERLAEVGALTIAAAGEIGRRLGSPSATAAATA